MNCVVSSFASIPLPFGGDTYDKKRIQTFQPEEIQFGCKDCNSANWKSLQIQHQLSYNMDSQIPKKSINWKGDYSA